MHIDTTRAMQGSGRIWMAIENCRHSDQHALADCNFFGWGISTCTHADDVVIECSRKYLLITVKLYFLHMLNLDHISFLAFIISLAIVSSHFIFSLQKL